MSFKLGIATHGKKTCNSSHDSSHSPSAKGAPSVIRFLNRLLEYLLSCESLLPPCTLLAPRRQPEKKSFDIKRNLWIPLLPPEGGVSPTSPQTWAALSDRLQRTLSMEREI